MVEIPVPFPASVLTAPEQSRRTLRDLFGAALEAVSGQGAVSRRLAGWEVGAGVVVLAVGKAAQAMTAGAQAVLGERLARGLVVSKAGHLDSSLLIAWGLEGLEAGHPLPTAGSLLAGRRALEVIAGLKSDERLLVLISGGASSLLEVPAADLGLADLVRVNRWLLGSGLPIADVNGVRKALSAIKGGGLLRWLRGRPVRVLALSDVPGDDSAAIGSGLLVPDPDLGARLAALRLPHWLREKVAVGLRERGALPQVGPCVEIVANLDLAKRAVAEAAQARGIAVHLHRGLLEGEAADRGRELARALLAGKAGLHVWGGETTVRLPSHPGRGGRNQQLALAAAMVLAGHEGVCLLSAGTDGSDGPTDDAGALIDGGTLARARAAGLDVQAALRAADAGTLLAATADLVHTGPTGTNVMDLVLGYCFAPRQ